MIVLLIKRGILETNRHTGRTLCEDKGRDWGDASTSQGMPKTAIKPPEARREAWSRFPSWFSLEATLPILSSQISSSQNCETIDFYCLRLPFYDTFVKATLTN